MAFWLATAVFVLLPYVFLGGLLRSRVLQAGAVGGLMARLAETPGPGRPRATSWRRRWATRR